MLALQSRFTGATASAPDYGEIFLSEDWSQLKRWRRKVLAPIYRLPDRGILGLTPLRTHILVCGFPRSGTTMLQMMLENGLPQARRFGREVGGWRAATYSWRNHPIVISKVPHDVFRLEQLRKFYEPRPAQLRIILMQRDPRDVLTSRRTLQGKEDYVVSPERWRRYFQSFIQEQQRSDVLVIRYEQLVADVAAHQAQIEQFAGQQMAVPFTQFHTISRPDFDTATLNGLRPVESSVISRWRNPAHRERIEQMLVQLPELPQALIDLGYETDDRWIEQWRSGQPSGLHSFCA